MEAGYYKCVEKQVVNFVQECLSRAEVLMNP